MASEFAAPPINTIVSITPLTTSPASRDATSSVPAQLANVATGTLVEGFVVNRDGQSNPILRTALGDVLVKADVFIKTGSEVVFRVDPTQPGHARLLSIDGLPPQDYATANTRGITGDTVQNAGQAAQQAGLGKNVAAPISALLVSTTPLAPANIASNPMLSAMAAGSAPVLPGLLKLTQGAQLQVKLLQVSLPVQGDALEPAQTNAAPSAPPPLPKNTKDLAPQQMANANTAKIAMQGIPQTAAPQTAAPSSTPQSVGQLVQQQALPPETAPMSQQAATIATAKAQAQITNLPLPPAATNTAPVAAQPAAPKAGMPAYVLGHEGDGATILQTPVGTLKSYLPQKLPVGTAVRLDLQVMPTQPQATAGAAVPVDAQTTVTTLAQQWPALEEALALFPSTHEAARPLMQAMPEIGPKLTSGLLFFIAAVKTGDLRQWLGNRAVSALETRAPDLAARLKGDMLQLQTLLVDSPLQQWNSAMIPMLYQGHLEHARLFIRDDREHSTDPKKKGGGEQRFIVEVDTSHLGEVQFDGFVRAGEKAKQFDLIVRSGVGLPAELQSQVRGTFETAMETTGMKGYLAFQQGSHHFVRPMAAGNTASGPKPILA